MVTCKKCWQMNEIAGFKNCFPKYTQTQTFTPGNGGSQEVCRNGDSERRPRWSTRSTVMGACSAACAGRSGEGQGSSSHA